MKYLPKKAFLFIALFSLAFVLFACDTTGPTETAQGVTDTTIKVGNTAATSGALAPVGQPFNDAMKAVFEEFNRQVDAGTAGYGNRKIEFVHYDDGFNAAQGFTYTERLVEVDKVFALVGHFGTPAVGATIDYIQGQGIPMVYAATGINALYFERTPLNPVMAVQPIYKTEGQMMLARILYEEDIFGEVNKIAAVVINDDAGNGMYEGVQSFAHAEGISDKLTKYTVPADATDLTSYLTTIQGTDADVIIFCGGQLGFVYLYSAMFATDTELPIMTSYVNAAIDYINPAHYDESRAVYANAWLDITSAEAIDDIEEYERIIDAATFLSSAEKDAYKINAFAMAGYVAASVFIQGVIRLNESGGVFTWENFIAEMERLPINIPMGGNIDYGDGKRHGIQALALVKYIIGDLGPEFIIEREIATLSDVVGE